MFSSSPEKSPCVPYSKLFPPTFSLTEVSRDSPTFPPKASPRRVEERLKRASRRRRALAQDRERQSALASERSSAAAVRREKKLGERRRAARDNVERAREVCRTVSAARQVQGWARRRKRRGEVLLALGEDLALLASCFEEGKEFEGVVGAMRGRPVVDAASAFLAKLLGSGSPSSPRNFLSSLLMTRFPNDTIDDSSSALSQRVLFVGRRVLEQLKAGPRSHLLQNLTAHVIALDELFQAWKEEDKLKLGEDGGPYLERHCVHAANATPFLGPRSPPLQSRT